MASNCLNKHALILGSVEPFRFDFKHVREAVSRPAVAADLKEIEIHDVYDLLDCLVYDENAVRAVAKTSPLNTDDRLRLEFSCAIPKDWELALAYVLGDVVTHFASVIPYLTNFDDPARDQYELTRRAAATKAIFLAQLAELRRLPRQRKEMLETALRENPGEAHVRSCQAEFDLELADLRAAMQARPFHPVLAQRYADKLYLAAWPPNRPVDMRALDEAALLYQRIVASKAPAPPRAFVNLADIHFKKDRKEAAEEVIRRCLALHPDSSEAHDMLAGILAQTGRLSLALEHIDKAIRLSPGDQLLQSHRREILQSVSVRTQ